MEAYILDQSFNTLCEISQYESFIWTVRYNEAGDFEIIMPVIQDLIQYLKRDNYVIKKGSDRIMVIEKIFINDSVEDGAFMTISGRSVESLLDRRVIWGFTYLSGNIQNGIKKLLNENAINPSIEARKIPHLIFRDTTNASITAIQHDGMYEGENLYDTIVAICDSYGVGFRILFEEPNLVFELYMGLDRSYNQETLPWVVFSPEYDNLRDSTYLESASATKTTVFIIGNGDGPDPSRVTTYYDKKEGLHLTSDSPNQTSGLTRREMAIEASVSDQYGGEDTMTPDYMRYLMQTKGIEALAETYENPIMFDGEILPTNQYVLNKDYFIGDVVQVSNKFRMEMRARVIEIIESEGTGGYQIIPTFVTIEEEEETE